MTTSAGETTTSSRNRTGAWPCWLGSTSRTIGNSSRAWKSSPATFVRDVKDEPKLELISAQVAAKRAWVLDQLRIINEREDAAERDRRERIRFARFLELRQNAQLLATLTGDQLSANPTEKLRASAHEALALYAQDSRASDADWALTDALPRAISPAELARLREGCYDLLLILSQAAPPAEGLRILDRAVQLHPQLTASYHLRRADCLDRAGDRVGRDREIQAARTLRPSTPLDYFLNGRELVVRRDFDEAIRSLDRALQLDPDQTSAHLLLAVCDLAIQPKRLREAIISLSACVRANPGVVGLYLLRASAYGEEGNQALARIVAGRTGDQDAARWKQKAIEAFEAAEVDFGQALGLERGDDLRYGLLTHRALLRLRADRLDEAMADLHAAIRLRPDAYQAHTTMAQVFQRQERLDDAFAAFGRAIGCRPEPPVLAGLYRSRALLHATRRESARPSKNRRSTTWPSRSAWSRIRS